jgi:hypothetical protein
MRVLTPNQTTPTWHDHDASEDLGDRWVCIDEMT